MIGSTKVAESPKPEHSPTPLAQLLDLIDRASKRVPVIKFAYGLVGIAAAGAAISILLGTSRGAIIIITLTLIGSILLFIFSKLSASNSASLQSAGEFMIWTVVAFFSSFLLLTTTAFVAEWPKPWVRFLGLPNGPTQEFCDTQIRVMFVMLNNFDNQAGDALRQADEVQACDPFQAETVRGSVLFYRNDYYNSAEHFEKALKMRPNDDPIKRNLADVYVELGRYGDAISMYNAMNNKDYLWSYKVGRALFYNGDPENALAMLKSVPADLREDGNLLGRPQILKAAILVQKSKSANGADKDDLLSQAHDQFALGLALARDQWRPILQITHRTPHEGFSKTAEILGPYLDRWLKE
jgi:hypothetical protein